MSAALSSSIQSNPAFPNEAIRQLMDCCILQRIHENQSPRILPVHFPLVVVNKPIVQASYNSEAESYEVSQPLDYGTVCYRCENQGGKHYFVRIVSDRNLGRVIEDIKKVGQAYFKA